MNIISENVHETSIEKEEQMVKDAIGRIAEYGGKIVDKVQKEFMPLLKDFVKNLTGEMKGIAFGKEVDILDMPTLISIAKKHIVPKSNEIAALKVKQDDCFFIYLAYSKDRQLLATANNKYIIIKAQTLSKEVEEIFAESELVILK